MLVALTGKKGSGKDTAALTLMSQGFVRLSFAEPVRNICREAFKLTLDEMSDPALKEAPINRWPYRSPRELMQLVGTEMFRTYFHDIWVENMLSNINNLESQNIVITDLRFLNEYQAVKNIGGTIVRIVRPGGSATEPSSKHLSEVEMESFGADYIVYNDSTVKNLHARINEIVNQ